MKLYSELVLAEGCMADTFLIRRNAWEKIAAIGYAFYPIFKSVERMFAFGTSITGIPRISFWIYHLLAHPSGEKSPMKLPTGYSEWILHVLDPKYDESLPMGQIEIGHPKEIMSYNTKFQLSNKDERSLPQIYAENVSQETIRYLIEPKLACRTKVKLIGLIKTAYVERKRRDMIRNMFKTMLPDGDFELFFLLGYHMDQQMGYRRGQFVKTASTKVTFIFSKEILNFQINFSGEHRD